MCVKRACRVLLAGYLTNSNLNITPAVLQTILQILRLRGRLTSPSNHSNTSHTLERLREEGEQVPSSPEDGLGSVGKVDLLGFEDGGLEGVEGGGG